MLKSKNKYVTYSFIIYFSSIKLRKYLKGVKMEVEIRIAVFFLRKIHIVHIHTKTKN
jgi:hypothetical protein